MIKLLKKASIDILNQPRIVWVAISMTMSKIVTVTKNRYGRVEILVRKAFEGDLSCDVVFKKLKI